MLMVAIALGTAVPIVLGLLVVCRSRQRLIGCLLIGHGLSFGALLGGPQLAGDSQPVVAQLAQGAWIFLFGWLAAIAYLLPDGRPMSRGWRTWMWVAVGGALAFVIGAAGDRDGFRDANHGMDPPLTWLPEPLSNLLGVSGLVVVVVFVFGSAVAVRSRLRRSSGTARLKLLWLVWGALAVPVGLLLEWLNHFLLGGGEAFSEVVLTGISVIVPTSIAVAILRYALFDIQVVLSRTLTYVALVASGVALYAALLAVAYRVGATGPLGGLLAVTVVAVALYPAQAWLRRRFERWVYGYRSQPHQAIRLVAERAEAAEPGALVKAVTDAVAEALRVDRVRVDTEPAAAQVSGDGIVQVPLVHRGETVGTLVVELPPGRRLSTGDWELLRDLARYAAVLVQSEWQNGQLRESRSRIVAGREEERRRLRRDLHDGVGPSLAAVVLTLNAAQSRTGRLEQEALIAEARAEVKDAIAEVRRAVDDLRPPAIDEVGLLGAIRQRAAGLSGTLTIEVHGPDTMPALPAGVEVAAYRIAAEAMSNAARHSSATHCQVDVVVNGQFEMTVADNGTGGPAGNAGRQGTGWTSMRERAAELGGSCTISRRPGGGVVVHALVPLSRAIAVADRPPAASST